MATTREITVDEMRQAVVGGNTYKGYKYQIWKLLEYGLANQERLQWLTPTAVVRLEELKADLSTVNGTRRRQRRKWTLLKNLLMACHDSPILDVPKLTPESYMEFMQSQRNPDGSLLKAKNYTTKTSALNHLFRCHNELEGYPPGFEPRLKTRKIGFERSSQFVPMPEKMPTLTVKSR